MYSLVCSVISNPGGYGVPRDLDLATACLWTTTRSAVLRTGIGQSDVGCCCHLWQEPLCHQLPYRSRYLSIETALISSF